MSLIRTRSGAAATARRPRVEGAREVEIYDCTALLLAQHGYDRLTLDAVAAAARTSKATLYRRWSGKEALVLDALVHAKCMRTGTPPDTGSLRADLIALACGDGGLTEMEPVAVIGALLPALQRDPTLFETFRDRLIAPKTEVSRRMLERARSRGEIGADADLTLIAQLLPSVCIYRSVVLGEPITPETVEHIVDSVVLPACRAGRTAAEQAPTAGPAGTTTQPVEKP